MENDFKIDNISAQFVLKKYKSDLELLERGRDAIVNKIEHSDDGKQFDMSRLDKLNKSIERMRKMISDFEENHVEKTEEVLNVDNAADSDAR